MRVLRVLPKVRSEHFERTRDRTGRVTIYRARYDDLESSALDAGTRRVSIATAWLWGMRRRWDVVELPEPLWLRALPLTLSVGLAVRVSDLVRRRRTTITTYLLENNDPDALLRGLPGGPEGVLVGIVRLVVNRLYDRVALGSPSAGDCYARLRLLVHCCEVADFEALSPACAGEDASAKSPTVAFVGALERRKGLPDLLAAWGASGLADQGWELRVAGSGPLAGALADAAAADRSIVALGPLGRRDIHGLLSGASVVVLPSRRDGRWREQIGLSIVEGLAHGCRVVATPDSGLAAWLRRHGHRVLSPGFAVDELAEALRGAADDRLTPDQVRATLPAIDGRTEAEDWMYAARPA